MPKPWRAAARAKASSEISPRRFVVCSRSNGVWALAGRTGRAWAGRCLRPGDEPLRFKCRSQFSVLSSQFSVKSKRRKREGSRQFLLYIYRIAFWEGANRHDVEIYFSNQDNELRGNRQV